MPATDRRPVDAAHAEAERTRQVFLGCVRRFTTGPSNPLYREQMDAAALAYTAAHETLCREIDAVSGQVTIFDLAGVAP